MSGWLSRTLSRRVFPRRPSLSSARYLTRKSRVFLYVPHSTMPTSSFEYGYIEDVERLEDYQPGGYHPIHIDDRLHKRYRIVHKLGHGAFSTAWLALDEQASKYVAIKVGTTDADRREADILSQLTTGVAACSLAADKASMIPITLDRFSLDGPNGTHPCFVTVPARCSVVDAKDASGLRLLQLDVARSLAAQLAMAVSIVHSQGYAHGGACFLSPFRLSCGHLVTSSFKPSSWQHPSPAAIYSQQSHNRAVVCQIWSPRARAGRPSRRKTNPFSIRGSFIRCPAGVAWHSK